MTEISTVHIDGLTLPGRPGKVSLLGPSITLPIRSGKLILGTGQQVVAINQENHSRKPSIEVTIIVVV